MFRWRVIDRLAGRGPTGDPGAPATLRPYDRAAMDALPASLTWIGHATFLLRLGGEWIATDPIWSLRIQGVVPRWVPPGIPLAAAPRPTVVVVSHNHYDHLDLPTLKALGPDVKYIVPLGTRRLLQSAGLPDVTELDWWASTTVGALKVTLVPARHWSMRAPWNRNDMLWGGFVLEGPEGTAYHAGDTARFDGFAEIRRRCGPIDWAMLPIGAYAPRWFMEPQHMDPDDALAAYDSLGARTFVAMHWGTFRLTDEALSDPPARIRALWAEGHRPPEDLWVMDIGETRALTSR